MPKRQRGKTNFHLLSRWTKRRHIINSNIEELAGNLPNSSNDFDGIDSVSDSDKTNSKNEDTLPDPSNQSIYDSTQNDLCIQDDIDGSSEISSVPDVNHIFLLSSEESEQIVSESEEVDSSSDCDFIEHTERIESPNTCGENVLPEESNQKMLKFLQSWGNNYDIPQNALDALLSGLKEHPCFSNLPGCSRTILKTPRTLTKIQVAPGEYIHTGIEVQLQKILKNVSLHSISEIKLMVNVDGLPPYKSCQGELYPILISILNIPELSRKVVPVGIYYGLEKPHNVTEYLSPFVNEAKSLVENGIMIQNRNLALKFACFCLDAPAKSFVMGIIGHGGFNSCTKCKVRGVTVEKKRIFDEINCEKRTNNDFLAKTDKRFQTGDTPLTEIPYVNFVDSFVLDYMHLVCLGVMRTLLCIWNCGTKSSKRSRLSKGGRNIITDRLLAFKTNVPLEFARKPRDMKLILRWKATEFRTFLLYLGPVALKGILDVERYKHFLALHSSMTILLSPTLCRGEHVRSKARLLLKQFVESMSTLYGRHLLTHNFHGLIHLVDDADNFVDCKDNFSLNDISAFQFENFLQTLKKMLRGRSKPLEQIGRRLAEKFCLDADVVPTCDSSTTFPQKSLHQKGPLLAFCSDPQYQTVEFPNFKISINRGESDKYCGTEKGDIIQVHNIAYCKEKKTMVVIGKKFLDKSEFYVLKSPEKNHIVSSSELGIYQVKTLSSWHKWPISKITKKYLCLPYKSCYIVFPLLHSVA